MAPKRCTICLHPERPGIEHDMAVQPGVNAAIAERWGVGKDSIRRHRAHLSPALKAVATRRESRGAETALTRLENLHTRASAILDRAEGDGQNKVALDAIKELRGLVELLARLTGELDTRPTITVVNVLSSPEWLQVRGVLLDALGGFPAAAQVVSERLLEIEQ